MNKPKAAGKAGRAIGQVKSAGGGEEMDRVRELARIAAEFDLAEIEVEPAGRVRLARRVAGGAAVTAHAPSVMTSPAPALAVMPAPAARAEAAEEDGSFVTSPFVGTFYRSPSPEAPVFVEIGQVVRKGQVVCIIEAMKLMNEIESEAEGKLVEVLVKNAEHVEYGQKLFRLAKA
jgi:acetyl-CoA carboxylase biotin carboxyl carrier protein